MVSVSLPPPLRRRPSRCSVPWSTDSVTVTTSLSTSATEIVLPSP